MKKTFFLFLKQIGLNSLGPVSMLFLADSSINISCRVLAQFSLEGPGFRLRFGFSQLGVSGSSSKTFSVGFEPRVWVKKKFFRRFRFHARTLEFCFRISTRLRTCHFLTLRAYHLVYFYSHKKARV